MFFEFHLARDLGMTHSEMMRRMSCAEFARWVAFYQKEKRDQERERRRRNG